MPMTSSWLSRCPVRGYTLHERSVLSDSSPAPAVGTGVGEGVGGDGCRILAKEGGAPVCHYRLAPVMLAAPAGSQPWCLRGDGLGPGMHACSTSCVLVTGCEVSAMNNSNGLQDVGWCHAGGRWPRL